MILYHLRDGTVSGAIVGLNECTGRLLVLLTLVAVELKNSSLFSLYQNFLQCQTKLQQRADKIYGVVERPLRFPLSELCPTWTQKRKVTLSAHFMSSAVT